MWCMFHKQYTKPTTTTGIGLALFGSPIPNPGCRLLIAWLTAHRIKRIVKDEAALTVLCSHPQYVKEVIKFMTDEEPQPKAGSRSIVTGCTII